MRVTLSWRIVAVLSLVLLASSCRVSGLPDGAPLRNGGEGKGDRCKVVAGADNPWLVEWDPADKVRIESQTEAGVLLVRYEGCELEILYGCEVPGKYDFQRTARKTQTEYITNEDELFAKMPIGALNLVSEFKQGDRWSLEYVLMGSRNASVRSVGRGALEGHCKEATHFVSGMAVGSYRLGSQAHRKGHAETSLYGAGAGGQSGSEIGMLRRDGDYELCGERTTASDHEDCKAIVKLFLLPVREGGAPPSGSISKSPSLRGLEPKSSTAIAGEKVQQPGTELYWLRCPVGQRWSGKSCTGTQRKMAWKEANSACPTGYRLPTRQEFVDLLGGCDSSVRDGSHGYCNKCSDSTTCSGVFLSTEGWYWSSSPGGDRYAWRAHFGDGHIGDLSVQYDHHVRCVRSGS